MNVKRLLVLAGLLALALLAGCRSAHVTSAILYIDQQLYDKAIQVLNEGLEYNPDEPEAFFYLGEAYSHKAEEAIKENKYLDAKRYYQTAYNYYRKAEKMDPQLHDKVMESLLYNYVNRTNDAKREYQKGYYEAAEGFFRLAYAALPDSLAPIKNLARMKIKIAPETEDPQQTLEQALDLLDQVLKENPDAYSLLADKASVLAQLGRKEEAAALYDRLLKEHPDDAGLLIDVANLAQQQNDYARAADLLARVVDIYEHDDDVSNDDQIKPLSQQIALLYSDSSVKRYADALRFYDKALSLEDFPEENTLLQKLMTHFNYARYLEDQAAQETDPDRKAELERQAKEQYRKGVNVGNSLVEQYPSSANGYFYLSLCQTAVGDTAAAEENMKMYNKLSGGE